MIYCQEYSIVTGCKQIVEVVGLSNQAIKKQITHITLIFLLINQSKKVVRFLSSLSPFIFIVAIEIDMT
jgi:hypothetical protein